VLKIACPARTAVRASLTDRCSDPDSVFHALNSVKARGSNATFRRIEPDRVVDANEEWLAGERLGRSDGTLRIE
jgi:hypothetical protein